MKSWCVSIIFAVAALLLSLNAALPTPLTDAASSGNLAQVNALVAAGAVVENVADQTNRYVGPAGDIF